MGRPGDGLQGGEGLVGKVKLIAKLCQDDRLTAAELRVATALIAHFHNTRTGKCYPSYEQLAKASCTSKTTAKRTTKKLREMGVIDFAPNTGGRSQRNSYVLKTVAPTDPLQTSKGASSGPYEEKKGSIRGSDRGSPLDPHLPNEISNENGRTPSKAPDLHSQAAETLAPSSPTSEEIKRQDEMLRDLKAQLAETSARLAVR